MTGSRWCSWAPLGVLISLVCASAVWSTATSPTVASYHAAVTSTTAATVTTIATNAPTDDATVTHLGGTVLLRAVNSFLAATPEVPTDALLSITLDHIIDPAQPSSTDGTIAGDRWVELLFALKNADSKPFIDQQPPYAAPLTFVVDNTSYDYEPGAQPLPHEGYASVGTFTPSGPGRCAPALTIEPGATALACLGFQVPIGVPVVLASVALTLGNSAYGSLGEWRIRAPTATAATTTTTTPVAPNSSLEVAHLGQTLTLSAPTEQLTTGPRTSVVRVTLDHVLDPDPSSSPSPGMGDREVDLSFTLSNEGNAPVPCYENDEYQLSFDWAFDSDPRGNGGYTAFGLPDGICADVSDPVFNGLAPGATATGDIPIELPIGVPVVNVFVGLGFAGDGDGSFGGWLVP